MTVKKFKLLLLDADVVIEISKHRLWDKITRRCEIFLSRIVVEEAQFYYLGNGDKEYFNLQPYVENKTISVFDITLAEMATFISTFKPDYAERLHTGESESLVYLFKQPSEALICSADKIVCRVLGSLNREQQGISLEEILDQIGLGRSLQHQFCKKYREEWSKKRFCGWSVGICK